MLYISTHCEIPFSRVKYVVVLGWQNNSARGAITAITTTLAAVNTSRTNCSSSSIKLPRRRITRQIGLRTPSLCKISTTVLQTPSANVTDEILSRSMLPAETWNNTMTAKEKTTWERETLVSSAVEIRRFRYARVYVSGLIVLEKPA